MITRMLLSHLAPIAALGALLLAALEPALGARQTPAPSPPSSSPASSSPSPATPATATDEVRFAVIGDMGNGSRRQRETASQLWLEHARFLYTFVITVGDNMYGAQEARDYQRKFEDPYRQLIAAGIPFYASLGNHDRRDQVDYPLFNMRGREYYTFRRGPVQFFALDSMRLVHAQVLWLENELARSDAPWKIAYFHHPFYSSGRRHGPSLELRSAFEPLLATYGVQVVFTGHEHFYERLRPRFGIQSFITGSGGQLRQGDLTRATPESAFGYDRDNVFLLAAVRGDELRFEAITRKGMVVDQGVIAR